VAAGREGRRAGRRRGIRSRARQRIWFTLPVSMASLVLAEIAAPELGRRTRAWLIALAILGLVLATGRILTTL
jgi:hypothetical protein